MSFLLLFVRIHKFCNSGGIRVPWTHFLFIYFLSYGPLNIKIVISVLNLGSGFIKLHSGVRNLLTVNLVLVRTLE